MRSRTFKGWLAAIGLLWLTAIVGGILATPQPTATATVFNPEPDPARDHRLRAAQLMYIRVSKLNDRIHAQCKDKAKIAPPDCTSVMFPMPAGSRQAWDETAKDEADFMMLVDQVQRWERVMVPAIEWRESH